MNHYTVDYVSVNMVHRTILRRGLTEDSVRQAFAQWQLSVGDTALAAHPVTPVVVRRYTPEYNGIH